MRLNAAALAAALVLVAACGDAQPEEETAVSDPTTSPTAAPSSEAPTTSRGAADERVGGRRADDIPVAFTPAGGWTEVPAPVLAGCTEPLVDEAPDLRGWWEVVEVTTTDGTVAAEHPALGTVQRVEQCGDRVVVTAAGVIHDMRCDGTEEHGVHDVAEVDKTTPITVVATYEDGVHVLRPVGIPIEVTRRREGDDLIWTYLGFTARMQRLGPPDGPAPEAATRHVTGR